MDDSLVPAPVVAKNEDKGMISKANVKSLDHSPARASIKSSKSTIEAKTNSFSFARRLSKNECKSQTAFSKKVKEPADSLSPPTKIPSSASTKSPSSISLRAKSKIPARQRSISNNLNKSEQKPQNSPRKTLQQKREAEKQQSVLKQKPINKSSVFKSEFSQTKSLNSNISKPNLERSSSAASPGKRAFKSHSVRSNSETPVAAKNERSASNVSTRSTPCPRGNTEKEASLRKIISTAGDCNKTDNVEKDRSQQQNESLPNSQMESCKYLSRGCSASNEEIKSKIKAFMEQWFASLKNDLKVTEKANSLDVEQLQVLETNNILSYIDDLCASYKELSEEKYKAEADISLKEMEKKYKDLIQKQEEEQLQLEKNLVIKAGTDIAMKDEHIKELQKKFKIQEKQLNTLEKERDCAKAEKNDLQEEVKNYRESLSTASNKLHEAEQQLKKEKRDMKCKCEIINKLENELLEKKKLETELAEKTIKLEELQAKMNKKAHDECVEHLKQISELAIQLKCLENEKGTLKHQNEKFEKDINELAKINEKLLATENKLQEVQTELDNKNKSLERVPINTQKVEMELAKFRQSEMEKVREIEKLKMELSKTQLIICQLEQQVQRDQQLLEVRSGLINSLQANEKTHRIQIEDLFAQVGEKNNTINELNCELQSKSEEFRNVFSDLSAKQMEAASQEHIIKLLQESNERSQMLRVKQEEKIGRLEEELAYLKHTIKIYQNHCQSTVLVPY